MINSNGAYEHYILWTGAIASEHCDTTVVADSPLLTRDVIEASMQLLDTTTNYAGWAKTAIMNWDVVHKDSGKLMTP